MKSPAGEWFDSRSPIKRSTGITDETTFCGRQTKSAEMLAFGHFLRMGRRTAAVSLERQYNHNHDPRNGQFTFGPGGAGALARVTPVQRAGPELTGVSNLAPVSVLRGRAAGGLDANPFSPAHPKNHSVYVVKKGDSLTKIAASRTGLRVSDLAELNGIRQSNPLRVGQTLIVPHQKYLDAGKAARDNFVNLAYFLRVHDGVFPPNSAKAPDILDPVNWTKEHRNGYEYALDASSRMRTVDGTLTIGRVERRSKRMQREAGGTHRRPDDHGGHYIAPRFNGPAEAFNHFAQNANFNRGAYRVMEDDWQRQSQTGKKIHVHITAGYEGQSLRPSRIAVIAKIDGREISFEFENRKKGK